VAKTSGTGEFHAIQCKFYAYGWAVDTMKNPRYPLELFMRVITVSLETMQIVRGLPGLGI
jgi:predicted helicase